MLSPSRQTAWNYTWQLCPTCLNGLVTMKLRWQFQFQYYFFTAEQFTRNIWLNARLFSPLLKVPIGKKHLLLATFYGSELSMHKSACCRLRPRPGNSVFMLPNTSNCCYQLMYNELLQDGPDLCFSGSLQSSNFVCHILHYKLWRDLVSLLLKNPVLGPDSKCAYFCFH